MREGGGLSLRYAGNERTKLCENEGNGVDK